MNLKCFEIRSEVKIKLLCSFITECSVTYLTVNYSLKERIKQSMCGT